MASLEVLEQEEIRIVEQLSDVEALPDSPVWNGFSETLRTWPPRNGSVSRPYPLISAQSEPAAFVEIPIDQALAMAVRALAETRAEKKEVDKGFGERMERLQNEISRLSNDILTGQARLPLEV